MHRDFYATVAQVLPVLLLALMWDSGFLQRLGTQSRAPRAVDPSGVRWWTKPRVRVYVVTVAAVTTTATGTGLAVLAGLLPDSWLLRAVLTGAAALALATLLTRTVVDVIAATAGARDGGVGADRCGDPLPPPIAAGAPAPADRRVHDGDGGESDRVV